MNNEWQRVVQRMTTSGTTSNNEWQRITTSDNEWQWVTTNNSEWYNEWKLMRASKTKWFKFQNETKGQSGFWIISLSIFMQYITTIYSAI